MEERKAKIKITLKEYSDLLRENSTLKNEVVILRERLARLREALEELLGWQQLCPQDVIDRAKQALDSWT